MRDITHSVLARKSIQKVKHTFSNPKKFITALAVSLGIVGIGLSALASAANTVTWTGQGVTNGTLNTVQCSGDTPNPGDLLWVLTASGATSATIKITTNGPVAMTQEGKGASFHYVQHNFNGDFSALLNNVTATYQGTVKGNPQLVISHGCPALTAKVTLTKTFEQGPFTQATGGACFTLSPAAGTSATTQCSNTPEWDGLPTGSYTITETTTPAKYVTISPINFTVANNCSGVLGTCVVTGNSTATSLGTFNNALQPGHLQVVKLLGPAPGTTWTGPTVTFYVCANSPASSPTEQTATTCNASTIGVQTLTFATNQTTPTASGNLAEGYYTVCEAALSGYTVNDQCQIAQVMAGSVATDNSLTFINTPIVAFWCSPGFWATALSQNRTAVLNYLAANTTPPLDLTATDYQVVLNAGGAALKTGDPTTVTLAQVLLDPSTYGGPAFNSVADYIAAQLGWTGTQLTGENCPLDANGVFHGLVI